MKRNGSIMAKIRYYRSTIDSKRSNIFMKSPDFLKGHVQGGRSEIFVFQRTPRMFQCYLRNILKYI